MKQKHEVRGEMAEHVLGSLGHPERPGYYAV